MSWHRTRSGVFAVIVFGFAAAIPAAASAQAYADRDKDGVPDSIDKCPDVAGPKTSDPATNGCPNN